MSLFGKNIRKIRSVKSLSQQSFAEVFDLKRGTLGAYEEGRSEPKIETIIKIANYFSIPIDDLLTNELTVNQLSRFSMDSEYLQNKKEEIPMLEIPCIIESSMKEYIRCFENKNYIADLPQIKLPLQSHQELRAFLIQDLEMSIDDDGLFPNDIVIGRKVEKKDWQKLEGLELYIIVSTDEIIVRRVLIENDSFILKADHPKIKEKHLKLSGINELWKIEFVIYHRLPELKKENLKGKLDQLEAEFKKLRSSL